MSFVLWLAIMAVVLYLSRGEKPPTDRQIAALNRQSAYRPVQRD